MKAFCIGVLIDNNKNPVGLRLINLEQESKREIRRYQILDTRLDSCTAVAKTHPEYCINFGYDGEKLIGTNGSITRYPMIYAGGKPVFEKSPLMVLSQLGEAGYRIVDFEGKVAKVRRSEVVEYAKQFGISNGKVVLRNDVEFISSISGEYIVEEIKQGKKVNLNMRIYIPNDTDMKGIIKNTGTEVDGAINYKDAFYCMKPKQRALLKAYYVWLTVSIYKGMTHDLKLRVAPGKLEKLAELRGEDDWQFAGVWDTGFMGGGKCELGHTLRYEYYAVPSTNDIGDDTNRIVFGEHCASDFFNIPEEQMKKLVEVRKIMSDEVEYFVDVFTNGDTNAEWHKVEMSRGVVEHINDEVGNEIYGDELFKFIKDFIKEDIPFPESMIKRAKQEAMAYNDVCLEELQKNGYKPCMYFFDREPSNKANKIMFGFLVRVFTEYADELFKIFNIDNYTNRLERSIAYYLQMASTTLIDGYYQYDPLFSWKNEKKYKKEGGYNEKTRDLRRAFNYSCRRLAATEYSFKELTNLLEIYRLIYSINTIYRNTFDNMLDKYSIDKNVRRSRYEGPSIENWHYLVMNCESEKFAGFSEFHKDLYSIMFLSERCRNSSMSKLRGFGFTTIESELRFRSITYNNTDEVLGLLTKYNEIELKKGFERLIEAYITKTLNKVKGVD